jgi:hypothetical protein
MFCYKLNKHPATCFFTFENSFVPKGISSLLPVAANLEAFLHLIDQNQHSQPLNAGKK